MPEGRYGIFGGQYVPEVLIPLLDQVSQSYSKLKDDKGFQDELKTILRDFAGRPTPLMHAEKLSKLYGFNVYLKREDLAHTGAHKINNTVGQVLLAKRMGKKRIIAETGAGQHGVATAAASAFFGMECIVYMGSLDVERQNLNVLRMEMLGTKVVPVEKGQKTLKDAINEALRDWITNVETTHYCFGTVAGPHPFPLLVRDFQRIIGDELKQQISKVDSILACVGGGSNAAGIFYPYIKNPETELIGIEAAGEGLDKRHAATLSKGSHGVLHGTLSYVLQDRFGNVDEVHSVSAGLDYPGVGPEHALWKDSGRVQYQSATDSEALIAGFRLAKYEGILPAIESAHALAHLEKMKGNPDYLGKNIVVNISGRGDKDMGIYTKFKDLIKEVK